METAANPYALSMGAKETATQRLNLAQSFNPMGLILGLFIAQQYVLKKLQSDDISDFSALDEISKNLIKTTDLMVIRDPYVILGLVILGVLVLFAISKMPDSKDISSNDNVQETIKKLFKNNRYSTGVISQILYVGAQIMCWTYIYQYAEAINIDSVNAGYFQMIAFIVFLGRAFGTYFLRFINSGKLLMFYAIFAFVLMLGVIFIEGVIGLYFLLVFLFSCQLCSKLFMGFHSVN